MACLPIGLAKALFNPTKLCFVGTPNCQASRALARRSNLKVVGPWARPSFGVRGRAIPLLEGKKSFDTGFEIL